MRFSHGPALPEVHYSIVVLKKGRLVSENPDRDKGTNQSGSATKATGKVEIDLISATIVYDETASFIIFNTLESKLDSHLHAPCTRLHARLSHLSLEASLDSRFSFWLESTLDIRFSF